MALNEAVTIGTDWAARLTSLRASLRQKRWYRPVLIVGLVIAAVLILVPVHRAIFDMGLRYLEADGKARLSSIVANLTYAMDRHDRLPAC